MSSKRRGKKNRNPQRWLMLGLYPVALVVLLTGVCMFDWMAKAAESQPQEIEDFTDRDADDWLEKLGLDDMQDDDIHEATEEDIFDEDDTDIVDPGNTVVADSDEDLDDNQPDIENEEGAELLEEDESDNEMYYFYSRLSDSEKKKYNALYKRCVDYESTQRVAFDSLDEAERIFYLVRGDHPELFYLDGYNYMTESGKVTIAPNLAYSSDEIASRTILNNMAIDEVISSMPGGLSEYETIKYFYEWIVNNTEYDMGSDDNQEYSSVFLNHVSVCAGYSHAMQALLQKCNMQAMYVTGDAAGPHAWLIVRVDGQYYQLDVTWADGTNPTVPHPDYAYLCLTTEKIARTHTVDELYPIPECNTLDANFYVQEGLYVTGVDYDTLKEVFDKSKLEYKGTVYIMASDAGTYRALLKYLLDDGNVYSLYYGDMGRHNIMYITDDDLYTMSFYK